MKKGLCAFVLIMSLAFLSGCAAMPSSKEMTVLDTPPAPITPDSGSAVVTFFRPWSFLGGGLSFYISEYGQNIGALKNGTYFSIKTTPGTHIYSAATESTEQVTIQTRPSETVYVKGSMGFGFIAGRPRLQQVTAGDAQKAIQKLDYVQLDGR